MQVRSLGQEEPLDGGGHGNPLQHSCLGNSKDGVKKKKKKVRILTCKIKPLSNIES